MKNVSFEKFEKYVKKRNPEWKYGGGSIEIVLDGVARAYEVVRKENPELLYQLEQPFRWILWHSLALERSLKNERENKS